MSKKIRKLPLWERIEYICLSFFAKRNLTIFEFFLIKMDMDVNLQNEDGITPLMLAAKHNCKKLAELLIKSGAYLELKDSQARTALCWAAYSGAAEAAEILIKYGANPNAKSEWGTPLEIAFLHSQERCAELLVKNGGVINNRSRYNPLIHYYNGKYTNINLALKYGYDVNGKDIKGKTPLSYAAMIWAVEAAELLIKNSADVNSQDRRGRTPLMFAVSHHCVEMAELLIKNSADVNIRDKKGRTALMYAMFHNSSIDMVELLLKAGADVNTSNNAGFTPLMLSEKYKAKAISDLLIKNGAKK